MRLNNYLVSESRSNEISKFQFDRLLEQNCGSATKWKSEVYRGMYPTPGDYIFVSPSSATEDRKSPYATNNAYNLLLSNLPSWKPYPKRNMSIICTTDKSHAKKIYGVPYRVYPYDGAKIGVCPEGDIWMSFKRSLFGETLDFLNVVIKVLADTVNYVVFDKDFHNLIKCFDDIDTQRYGDVGDFFQKDNCLFEKAVRKQQAGAAVWNFLINIGYINDVKLFDLLNKRLDPDKNGFQLITVGSKSIRSNVEVWTDSDSLLKMLTKDDFI